VITTNFEIRLKAAEQGVIIRAPVISGMEDFGKILSQPFDRYKPGTISEHIYVATIVPNVSRHCCRHGPGVEVSELISACRVAIRWIAIVIADRELAHGRHA